MKVKLDHIYGESGSGDLTALQNQVNSLSQIAAKTNLDNRFTTNQTIPSVTITGAVDANNKAATKAYVDNKFNLAVLQEWTGNIQTTNLTWTKNTEFNNNGSGTYIFQIKITANSKSNVFTEFVKINQLGDTYIGNVHCIDYGADDANANVALPTKGISFIYSNKAIKIKKYGTGHPTAAIEIRYTKVW